MLDEFLVGRTRQIVERTKQTIGECEALMAYEDEIKAIARHAVYEEVSKLKVVMDQLRHFTIKPDEKYLFVIQEQEGYVFDDMPEDLREFLTSQLLEMGMDHNQFRVLVLGGIDFIPYAIQEG